MNTQYLKKTTLAMIIPISICLSSVTACAREANIVLPAPTVNETVTSRHEVIVLSGGCFWGVQGVFQHVKGVTNAVSGYAGGKSSTAHYELISSGTTGHAESVQVEYDPQQVSLGELLRIYFSVAHDPTELNRQGPDSGTQYRSAIWYSNSEQQKIAQAYISQLDKTGLFHDRIVTQINPLKAFYPAEEYHQNYLTLHPGSPYIAINDQPKIDNLKQLYPTVYRKDPMLVGQ